jgi:hypothetical protein
LHLAFQPQIPLTLFPTDAGYLPRIQAHQRIAMPKVVIEKVNAWSRAKVASQSESFAKSTAIRFLSTP